MSNIETSSPPSPPARPIFHSPRVQDDGGHWTDRIDGILNSPPERNSTADAETSPASAAAASTARRVRRRGTIELPTDGTKVRSFGRRPLSRRLTVEDTGIGGGAACPFTELQRAKRRASFRADDDAEVEKDGSPRRQPASSHAGPRFVPPKTRHDSSPTSRPRFVPSATPNEMSPSEPSSSITGRPVFVPPRETDHDEVRGDRICRVLDDARRQLPSPDANRKGGGYKNGMPRFVPPVDDFNDGRARPVFVSPVNGSGTVHPRPRLIPPVVDGGSVDGEETRSRICGALREGNLDMSFSSKMPVTVHGKGAGTNLPPGLRLSRPKFRPCRMHLEDDDEEVSSVAAVKDPSDRLNPPDLPQDSRRMIAEIASSKRPRRRRGTIEVPAEMRKPVGSPIVDGPAKEARRPRRRRGTIEIPDSVRRRPVGTPVVDVEEKPSKIRIKLERSSQRVCSYDSDACVGADANEAAVNEEGDGAEDPDESGTSLSGRLEARLATARRIREKLGDKSNSSSRGDKTKRKRRVTIEGPCPFTALQVEKQQSSEGRQNSRRPKTHKPTHRPVRRATDEGNASAVRYLRRPSDAESYPVGKPVEDSTLDWAIGTGDSHRSGSTGTALSLERIAEIKARFDRGRAKLEQRGSRLDQSTTSSSTTSITVDNLLDDSTRTDASEGRGRRRTTASDAEDVFEAHNSSFMCDNDCRGENENIGLSKSDNPSRWAEALDRYRRDGKSNDHTALEEPADDLPEDEVGRRGGMSPHDSFASLRSSGQKSMSVDALTDPTAAMSSSSFCLAKEEGQDAFDFVARPAGHSRVGSHISIKLLDESVSSLENSARSSELRRFRPAGPRSGSARASSAGSTSGGAGGLTPTKEQGPQRRGRKKSPRMRRRATADVCPARDILIWN